MKETLKEVATTVASHPKTSSLIAVFAAFLNNWWINYGSVLAEIVTFSLGAFVMILVAIKHVLDIRAKLKADKREK